MEAARLGWRIWRSHWLLGQLLGNDAVNSPRGCQIGREAIAHQGHSDMGVDVGVGG